MDGSFQRLRYYGPTRQRGSGLGALALRVGRTAIPILAPFIKKHVLPAAKRVGSEFIHNIAPSMGSVIQGKTSIGRALEEAVTKTVRQELQGGSKHKRSRTTSKKVTTSSSRKRKPTTSTKSKAAKSRIISRQNVAQSSRSKKASLFKNLE